MIRLVLAAWLTGCAVLVLMGTPVRRKAPDGEARGAVPPPIGAGSVVDAAASAESGGLTGLGARRVAAGAVGLGVAAILGGLVGIAVGIAAAVGVAVGLGRLETSAQRRERLAITSGAPIVADLLSAALAAGVPVEAAVPAVAEALGGPLGDRLMHVSRLLALGQSSTSAWSRLGSEDAVRPLVAATSRSARTGAPLAGLLAASADELRNVAQDAARAEIRAAGVRAMAPLGLCLLPAFVLLGIVPLVGGLVARLWG